MDKKEVIKSQRGKSHSLTVIMWAVTVAFTSTLVLLLFVLGGKTIGEILSMRQYYLAASVLNGILVIAFLLMYRVDAQNIALRENDLEDANWLDVKRLKRMREFEVFNFSDTKKHDSGIVIGAEKKGKGIEIITTDQMHALIVGTTGSGKTSGFVDQNISVLSRSRDRPCLLISDPKRELYERHAKQLKAEGYTVSVLDLREPYSSARWNPMNVLTRRVKMIKDLENNLENRDGKYYGAGETFLSYLAARQRVQELKDEIFENAQDLVYTLCPVTSREQPTWEECARNLILGIVLALCEDCINGKIEEKQLLLLNIYHNVTKYCSGDLAQLKTYLLTGRDEFSKVRGLVNAVLVTSDKTLACYTSEVLKYMAKISDDGILALTSENDLDISGLDEGANAVFVIVPDEKATRHKFVTLFITQAYKELVEKANLNAKKREIDSAILKRKAYFVLEEFGNLPQFENIDGMVTVARSRGVRFLFVLQSFSQIAARYGREVADTVKSNCNVKIFIGTDDFETRKEFSELCGNKKIKSFSVNTGAENPASSSTGASNRPLVTTGMLERLNGNKKGDAIISVRGYEPIWSKFTPSFLLAQVYFLSGAAHKNEREPVFFDKKSYIYDICGDIAGTKEVVLDAVDRAENELEAFNTDTIRISKLDEAWEAQLETIRRRIYQVSMLLKGRDRRTLQAAKLEDKTTLLYALIEKYDQTTAQRMRDLAEYLLNDGLPKLLELQEKIYV